MSKRDLQRVKVLTEVLAGRRTTESAAGVLNISLRQTQRLLARYEDGGGAALIHKARGRPASNTINAGVRDYVLELVRQNYRDFGPTLASEQFGRALSELNIEILCANSSQAKGRVERANRTLQDRLVKELRLAGVNSIEAGNTFLPAFMDRFNERFAVVPAKPDNLHRKVHLSASRLTDILCHREQRYLSAQLAFHYDRRQIILERNKTSEELAGKYVDLYDYTDGRLEVRWKGISLPYRVFRKDQRVTQTAIVENKRLGHALSLVKAQQDRKREAKVLTNSEKTGYQKRPRQLYGPDYTEKTRLPAAVEMTEITS